MSSNKLLIIAHTEHYLNGLGELVGWGPTITEINYLATIFEKVYVLAVFLDEEAPPSSLPYTSKNIQFVPLKSTGGQKKYQKLNIIWKAPSTIYKVVRLSNKVDVFQLRAPTGIGVYLIPFLMLFSKKKGWFKYAGNWNQQNPPFGYAIQRWFLKRQKRLVTINGSWPNQPTQCLTFENPCLTVTDRSIGLQKIQEKEFRGAFTYCFAGRLEDPKGVRRIIESFSLLPEKELVKEVHLIGNGPQLEEYKKLAVESGVKFVFHGFLKGSDVLQLFKESHFFLLPSTASEGFPKVIAEAMNFGCIPIVSAISSIGQYIKEDHNGLIVSPVTSGVLMNKIKESFELDQIQLARMQNNNYKLCNKFTYPYYVNRIKSEIIED